MRALSSISSSRNAFHYARNLILFLGIFFIMDHAVASVLKKYYEHIYTGPGRYNYIKHNRFDGLIMGSSTSTCIYDRILSNELGISVLNVGLDGSALIYTRSLLELVLANKIKPDFILLNVDLFEVLTSAWSGNYYSMIDDMRPLYGEVDYISKALYKGKPFEFIKYGIQSYRYNGLLLSIAAKSLKNEKIYRRGNSPSTVIDLPIDSKTMEEKFSDRLDIDMRKVHLYEEFISVCKKNEILVILIESPLYYPEGKLTGRDRKIEELFTDMTSRNHVPFIRITQETYPLFRNSLLFKDVLHLNHNGSILYSQVLCAELKRKGISRLLTEQVIRRNPDRHHSDPGAVD